MTDQELLRRGRRELMPGAIYAIVDKYGVRTDSYGDTADGEGMYWYDSLEDVAKDYHLETAPIIEVTAEQLEAIRYGDAEYCSDCGEFIADLEGYDGRCGDCADIEEGESDDAE